MNSPMPRIVRAVLFGLLAAVAMRAGAREVVLDFTDVSGWLIATNYERDGFRVSPNCHYDVVDAQALAGPHPVGNIVNFDFEACESIYNASFLGPAMYQQHGTYQAPAVLWVDHPGAAFSLESLFIAIPGWSLVSSGGGLYTAGSMGYQASFGGPEWTGINWLAFVNDGASDYMAFADLVLKVPEPGSLPLLTVALAGAAMSRRRLRPVREA
jgi:PEP-CTERM motif